MTNYEPFVLLINRRPPSGQKGPNKNFADHLEQQARQRWGARAVLSGDLYARITWFHAEKRIQDIDNISKRILDALKGIVFIDDKIVVQTLATAIDTMRDYTIVNPNTDDDMFKQLLEQLELMTQKGNYTNSHLVYIEVGLTAGQYITFGNIDRRSP